MNVAYPGCCTSTGRGEPLIECVKHHPRLACKVRAFEYNSCGEWVNFALIAAFSGISAALTEVHGRSGRQ